METQSCRPLSHEETQKLLDITKSNPIAHLYVLIGLTSPRVSEILSLRFKDFGVGTPEDFKVNEYFKIARMNCKGKNSSKKFSIPVRLAEHVAMCVREYDSIFNKSGKKPWNKNNYIFTNDGQGGFVKHPRFFYWDYVKNIPSVRTGSKVSFEDAMVNWSKMSDEQKGEYVLEAQKKKEEMMKEEMPMEHLTSRAIQKMLRKYYEKIGLDPVNTPRSLSSHTLRKTCAENVLEITNGNVFQVQQVLQHSDIRSTQKYIASNSEKTKEVVLSLFDKFT